MDKKKLSIFVRFWTKKLANIRFSEKFKIIIFKKNAKGIGLYY